MKYNFFALWFIIVCFCSFTCVTSCKTLPHESGPVTDGAQSMPAANNTQTQSTKEISPPLILGIERVSAYSELFKNKRVGLVTNATGIDRHGNSSIDILNAAVNLVALFAPEHGIRGSEDAGMNIAHTTDKKTGLPVYSLYGNTKRPTAEMLSGIDVLCFDIQDVGSRFYTYIWTLCYCMEACAQYNVRLVVFDRPNPIGNTVEGAVLQKPYASFVGYLPIAQRHGMTIGELARMFNDLYGINCELTVIPMLNYHYNTPYRDYKLLWIPTSPNIPHAETALLYSGMCLFEGVNLSVGRGTTMPFEYIGAPYIDAQDLAAALNSLSLEGVFFYPAYFTPTASEYKGIACQGVQLIVTDEKTIRPVTVAVEIFYTLKDMYSQFKIRNFGKQYAPINLLSGTNYFTNPALNADEVLLKMSADVERFMELRKPYLLYQN